MLVTLGRPYEIIYVDDGSKDGSFGLLKRLAERASRSRRHPVPPQLRADGGAGGRPRSVARRRRHLHGRRSPERPGRDPAPAPDDGRGRLRRRQRLAQEPAGRRDQPQAALADGELADLEGQRRPAARLRLHAQGVPPRRAQERQACTARCTGSSRPTPHWAGATVTELPVNHRARKYGTSKYGINRTIKVLLDLLTLKFLSSYSTKPIQLFGGLGAMCFLFGDPGDALHALLALLRGRAGPPEPGGADRGVPVPGRAALHHPGAAGRAGDPDVLRVARQVDLRHPVDARAGPRRAPAARADRRSGAARSARYVKYGGRRESKAVPRELTGRWPASAAVPGGGS